MQRNRVQAIFWGALVVVMLGCGGAGSSPTSPGTTPSGGTTPPTSDTSVPQLTAAFVSPDAAVAFYVFGATLPSSILNPTWEIETADQTTPVLAAMSGRVMAIMATAQGDQAITLQTASESIYVLVHDHVNDVRVTVGQTVTAGQQLGIVGRLNNARGRTELQLNRRLPAPEVAMCLRTFFSAGVNTAFEAASLRLNGSTNTCLAQTVNP